MKILLIMILVECNIAITEDFIQWNNTQYPVKYWETQIINKENEIFTYHYYICEDFTLHLYKYSDRKSTVIIYTKDNEYTYTSNIKYRKQ